MPEAKHVRVVLAPSAIVFEVSPESTMRTFEGGPARTRNGFM